MGVCYELFPLGSGFGGFGLVDLGWYLVVQLGVAGVGWACFVSAGFDSGICLLV